MMKMNLYVWFSAGKLDGDGYDVDIEITEEQYDLLQEYDGEELDEIDDPEIKDFCMKVYGELIEELENNSRETFEENPEDFDYDSFEEYWDIYSVGVRIDGFIE